MSPSACKASLDFVRLTAKEPSSLYFEKFLRDGTETWLARYQDQYPGLKSWRGISHLKQSLACTAGFPANCRVLLANRSAQLMTLAARLLFRRCRNVLATDLSWPSYHEILKREASRTGNNVSTVSIRKSLLQSSIASDELIDLLVAGMTTNRCDGVFLPAVDNLGVRLPVQQFVHRVKQRKEVRFVVIDGAQAFCHIPSSSYVHAADFFVAGCHKWLSAYHPMGIGFCGRKRSRQFIDHTIRHMIESFQIDDPLLRFTEQLERDQLDAYSETTGIAPLFSGQGALEDAPRTATGRESRFNYRKWNVEIVCDAARATGWRPIRPELEFQTGILLLRAESAAIRRSSADWLRGAFQVHGIILSTYRHGLIRLSMPDRPFADAEVDQIHKCLVRLNHGSVKPTPRHVTVPQLQ